ncbi:hypothetical protein DQG13_04600 [Paenibacillus sp. YN15]|nr:hypothetical protein DQG13_04600 [Paenibacillus sp. YN15]
MIKNAEMNISIPCLLYNYSGIADDLLELVSCGKVKIESKVIDFLTRETEAFQKSDYHGSNTIFFVSKRELPKIKTIIASATLNQTVYEKFIGEDLSIWNHQRNLRRGK